MIVNHVCFFIACDDGSGQRSGSLRLVINFAWRCHGCGWVGVADARKLNARFAPGIRFLDFVGSEHAMGTREKKLSGRLAAFADMVHNLHKASTRRCETFAAGSWNHFSCHGGKKGDAKIHPQCHLLTNRGAGLFLTHQPS
jgi:hypothetical protein